MTVLTKDRFCLHLWMLSTIAKLLKDIGGMMPGTERIGNVSVPTNNSVRVQMAHIARQDKTMSSTAKIGLETLLVDQLGKSLVE